MAITFDELLIKWFPTSLLQGLPQAREQGASTGSVFQDLGGGKGFQGARNEMQSLGREDTKGSPKMPAQV